MVQHYNSSEEYNYGSLDISIVKYVGTLYGMKAVECMLL